MSGLVAALIFVACWCFVGVLTAAVLSWYDYHTEGRCSMTLKESLMVLLGPLLLVLVIIGILHEKKDCNLFAFKKNKKL